MTENTQDVCIGIDLGTTNSEVACIHRDKPYVIKIDGSKIMPSVISIDDKLNMLIGKAAVNNELVEPTNTIRWIKRKMGRDELIPLGGKSYTPPMLSSLILKRLKLAAEEFLKMPVNKAVITVPAFFNEKQREATKEAAELAGLEPLRLLNEPTAAALAYALNKKKAEKCLVYDLGGGTFDVSIVDLSEDVMEVKASHGDTELGGADFDKLIAEKIRHSFLQEHQLDLAQNPIAWARVLRASEEMKIKLSNEPEATIVEEFITTANATPLHLKFTLTRGEFEAMIRPVLERSLDSVRKAMEMASMHAEDLDRVILVGGSTYIPLVKELLEKELLQTPQAWINPSTVVAMGAAIEAGRLVGQKIGPLMMDITPHTLGIDLLNEFDEMIASPLINRNTPIPATASRLFYKVSPFQKSIQVKVYQGESTIPSLNKRLDSFEINELTPSENMELHIKFQLDQSGLLHVTATEMASGKKVSHVVKKSAHSRAKHVNLADLDSVRIVKEETHDNDLLLESDEDNESIWDELDDFNQDSEQDANEVETEILEHSEILKRASLLLQNNDLDENDALEVKQELLHAQSGDLEALKRLSNLMYYLQ